MKNILCKILGHEWRPVFFKGDVNGKRIKFIACYCSRCDKGHLEIINLQGLVANLKMATYNESIYDRKEE
jgi:hypothetical protein